MSILSKQRPLEKWDLKTVVREFGNGEAFRIIDAVCGTCIFGTSGGGKTSGPGEFLRNGFLALGAGGVVLCAKKDEREQWERAIEKLGRAGDLAVIDASCTWRMNILEWEASRGGAGGKLAINIVALLDEIAGAVVNRSGKSENGGDNPFFKDALHYHNINLVQLVLLAGLRISLPLLRSITNSAPQRLEQLGDEQWVAQSTCMRVLREADRLTRERGDDDQRAEFEECLAFWTQEYPSIGEKTRGIIGMSFSMLVQAFLMRPLRKLFSSDTNITPEDTFNGKIIIIDLPVQEFRLAGRIANLAFKYCFQVAVLRRTPPPGRKQFLRPVFLWADECQNFISDFDAEYQAVARSAGGCTIYLTQNRESLRRVLGNNDAVDSLLANLSTKFFCNNTGDTNEWASKLLGEHWVYTNSANVGTGQNDDGSFFGRKNQSSGVTRSQHKRFFVEPSTFTTLKRGGELNNFQVEAIIYKGGHLFDSPSGPLPYKLLTFSQS